MKSEATHHPTVLVEPHDGWGELIMSRPDRRNALVGPMVAELRAGLAALLDGGARVILLRGEGGAFCSGLDVDAFSARPAWQATWPQDYAGFHRELYACPAVVVGALERYAINAGASLAFACDLLVAGETAYVLIGEAAIGMQAPMNVAWLRLRTTEAVAAQLALGAERTSGAELHRLGLAYKVVADGSVVSEAQALTARLAGYPGKGLGAIKAAMRRTEDQTDDIFATVQRTEHATARPARVTN